MKLVLLITIICLSSKSALSQSYYDEIDLETKQQLREVLADWSIDSLYKQGIASMLRANLYYTNNADEKAKTYREALVYFSECIYRRGDYMDEYYAWMADVYVQQHDYQKGIFYYSKALSYQDNFKYYHERGRCKYELKDYYGAISDLSSTVNMTNNIDYESYSEVYSLRSTAYANIHDFVKAVNDINKAIEYNGEIARYYLIRGLLILDDDKEAACLDMSKAGELGHPEAYSSIAKYCN
uniref:hypothetical protein n=1 Tax=Fulvivirga sp. TaxID=1931237 RepID=UPI004049EB16